MSHILIFEPNREKVPPLVFLLKLADIQCTVARSQLEALNWLSANQLLTMNFDLFLLNSLPVNGLADELMAEAIRIATVPTVCVQRDDDTPVIMPGQTVSICHPANLLSCIRESLTVENTHHGKELLMTETNQVPVPEERIDEDSMEGMFLTFELAAEGYGLEIRHVTEIIGIQKVTNVPDMPDHVIGVLNLRGKVIPIIDVRLRFHLPSRDYDERTCIIVVNVNGNSVGLIVDKVNEVVHIAPSEIEPSPATGKRRSHYIQGMGKLHEQVKILLDIDQLIEDEDLSDLDADVTAA